MTASLFYKPLVEPLIQRITDDPITYTWKRSSDGTTWQTISGATSNTYTLTAADHLKYIKCEAEVELTALSTTKTVSETTTTRIMRYGDVDLDGNVSILDAARISQYLEGTYTFTDEQKLAGDVDGDSVVTSDDLDLVQQYRANIITSFPVEGNG